jgi:hypothetical protein
MVAEKTDRKTKLANLANLPALLREVATEYGDEDDLQDLRSRLVSAMPIYGTSRFRLGQSLYAYRSALPHGYRWSGRLWSPVESRIVRYARS